jgi:ribosome assembly protein YihI (activator of Der GTPase)
LENDVSHEVQKLVDALHARLDKIETHLGITSQPEEEVTESTPESEHE